MGNRRKSREYVLQLLYQLDISKQDLDEAKKIFWLTNNLDKEVQDFTDLLVSGVRNNLSDIDDIISLYSKNWKLSRMAAIDKNILRIAVFELIHCPDIPVKVTINEAVEIAKFFGTEDSGSFVNGILDNIARKCAKDK